MATPAGGAPKRLIIKPLKKRSDSGGSGDEVLEATWAVLRDFIAAVYESHASSHSYQELYAAVEAAVIGKLGGAIYERLLDRVAAQVEALVGSLAHSSQDPAAHLGAVQSTWALHCRQTVTVRNVFLYLDRTYVRDTAGARPLWDVAMDCYRAQLLARPELLARIVSAFVALVTAERNGETVDRPMLSAVTRMCMALKLYGSHMQPALYACTDEYFASEGLACMASMDVPEYLAHVERRLTEERDRVLAVMDAGSLRAIIASAEESLVTRHRAAILEKGFNSLLDHRRSEVLRRLYGLMARVGKVEELRQAFLAYARSCCEAYVREESEEKDKAMVQLLLDFKRAMDDLIASAFHNNDTFLASLKSALEFAVNQRENKPAELVAKFIDQKMRGGARGAGLASDREVEDVLDAVMVLFRCMYGKDVFEAFYKKDLAKRLLLNKSASIDLERSMISKLKTECGANFTAKLEGMFRDMESSRAILDSYAESSFSHDLPCAFDVHVLTSSYWPTYTMAPAAVPPALEPCLRSFHAFYQSKFSTSRKLQWQHQLGHCLVRAAFPSGVKELEVSFFQALVLLQFAAVDVLPFPAIKAAVGIDDAELRRTLQSLALGQVRVLRKEPKGKEVEDGDVFAFNAEFKAPLVRLKINTIQVRETRVEAAATHERVMQDRQHQIDAALVRTMKTRKTLTVQALIGELLAQVRFATSHTDIKKRIESLIERDYLERDDEDINVLRYLA